jgi:hypothetical protein
VPETVATAGRGCRPRDNGASGSYPFLRCVRAYSPYGRKPCPRSGIGAGGGQIQQV